MQIYDNSTVPYRIFKKRKTEYYIWENANWSEDAIRKLVGLPENGIMIRYKEFEMGKISGQWF